MSRHLRKRGFDVHVVDPRRVQMISKDPRKTDRRDAELLARLECGMPELLGQVHHRSEQAQADLAILRTRDRVEIGLSASFTAVRISASMPTSWGHGARTIVVSNAVNMNRILRQAGRLRGGGECRALT